MTKIDHTVALRKFQERAGVTFRDESLLLTAFTHRSYLNEARSGRAHNERLEFLGDAVLELAVTDHLFTNYPDANEGDMTAYRAALVNAVMLGEIAESLGVNECLLLSRGESKDTGRARSTILANAFEAIIGAIYVDQGFEAARTFVVTHVLPHIAEVISKGTFRDAKSEYQEFAQAKYGLTPKYETVKAEGPDHARIFTVSVALGDVVTAEGEGQSKQEAEQDAARKALLVKDN